MFPLFILTIVPGTTIPSGPPAPHLERRPGIQLELQQDPAWRNFKSRWGTQWGIRWDERTATPRFLYAPGVPIRAELDLVQDVGRLAGINPDELFLAQESSHGLRRIATWRRFHQGVEVLGDQVAVVSQEGRIHGVWVQLSPISGLPTPLQDEMILPLPLYKGLGTASTGVEAHLVTLQLDGRQRVYRDRNGAEVHRYDTRHYGTIEMSLEERTVGDPMIEVPARKVTVESEDGTTVQETDDSGFHTLSSDPVYVHMSGSELVVTVDGDPILLEGSPEMLIEGGVDVPLSAASVHHHFGVTWDWLRERRPDHSWLSETVQATVELSDGTCNAYYTNGTINFYLEDPDRCHNLGQIADVVYHELGHGIHHYVLSAGTFAGDISEGSADYISATILNDPVLAPNAMPDGSHIRELETDRYYPDDVVGEVHTDGLIWGSFLWNLREQWSAEYGDAGVEQTDLLFLEALSQGPSLTDTYEAVILADDDDGDWSNSTPNACELLELLNHHGLGPGPLGVLIFEHDSMENSSSFDPGYPVQFSLYSLTQDCLDPVPMTAELWYTTDPLAELPETTELSDDEESDETTHSTAPGGDTGLSGDTGDTGSGHEDPPEEETESEDWTSLALTQEGDLWTGEFPRQLPTTEIRYFIRVRTDDGSQSLSTHEDQENNLFRFRVGDLEPLWCEGFEEGEIPEGWIHGPGLASANPDSVPAHFHSEWEVGIPGGGEFVPDSAYEGSFIMATGLDVAYSSSNRQHLKSPEIDLGEVDNPMRLLSYRRWLTVEDGLYDLAVLRANEQQLWENLETEEGSDHHLDRAWVQHELDLLQLEDPTVVQIDWSIQSDRGLEFGGWAIDEVCILELADVEGHYRVRDLSVSTTENPLVLRWTQPWIQPLHATVLVRKAGGIPSGPTDGSLIEMDLDPQYGEQKVVEDPTATPGRAYYYALFAASDAGEWVLETIEGENLAQGTSPLSEAEPTETGDSSVTADSMEESSACGCTSTTDRNPPGLWALLLTGLVYRRRRIIKGKTHRLQAHP